MHTVAAMQRLYSRDSDATALAQHGCGREQLFDSPEAPDSELSTMVRSNASIQNVTPFQLADKQQNKQFLSSIVEYSRLSQLLGCT